MSNFSTVGNVFKGRHDLPLIVLLLTIMALLILPIPTVLMDVFLAFNLTLAVIVLMVSVYLKQPLEFSTFPAIILLFTAFRIALSVASTRLILLEADAGQIIKTFGEFVVQGNVVVGMVVFLIITTVQFLVVTKGAERIAEVSARFTLDAMPGKQMSIEADIRNGDLGKDAGRKKRDDLSKESKFFGAMDGAMKFVKGDAIAGLIIILINLIGGISIGVAQKDMSFGEAMQVYSLLTVGDGLVSQIPALFIALCAGTVVTRVTSDASLDLGTDIVHQLVASHRGIWAAAGIVALTGFLPGFPTVIFLALASGLVGIAFFSSRKARALAASTKADAVVAAALPHIANHSDRIVLRVAEDDMADFDWPRFVVARDKASARFHKQCGYRIPSFGVVPAADLEQGRIRVEFDGVPAIFAAAFPKHLFCIGDTKVIALATGIPTLDLAALPYGEGCWVPLSHSERMTAADIVFYDVEESLVRTCSQVVFANLDELFSKADAAVYLESAVPSENAQIVDIQKYVDLTVLREVVRRLMIEAVPLEPRHAFFRAVLDWSPRETDPVRLAEYIRQGLRRQICNHIASGENEIATYLVDTRLDQVLRESIQATDVGGYLALNVTASAGIVETFSQIQRKSAHAKSLPAIVAANDVRRFLSRFLVRNNILLPVISQQELCAEFAYRPLGVARLKPSAADQSP